MKATHTTSRHQAKDRTRRALLDAAAWLVARQGTAATSLDQIAERAGYTKGAVYSNFRSKEELIFALVETASVSIDMADYLTPGVPLRDQFEGLGRLVARQSRSVSRARWRLLLEFFQLALRNQKVRSQWVADSRKGSQEAGLAVEQLAAAEGSTLPMEGAELMTVLSALALGLAQSQALDPETLPDDLFAKAFALLAPTVPERSIASSLPPR